MKPCEEMTLSELMNSRGYWLDQIVAAKAYIEKHDARILELTKDRLDQIYAYAGKQHGTAKLVNDSGMVVKASIDKKVEWDTKKLIAIAEDMPWDLVKETFKITFEVPEKIYQEMVKGKYEFLPVYDAARTVKYGAMKVTLEEKE